MTIELYTLIISCVLVIMLLVTYVLEWYDKYKEHKTMFIKDKEWLLMEDNTKLPYTTDFANAKYLRTGSYIQDINCYQPVYDKEFGVIRMIDNSVEVGLPCSVSPITLSEGLKENIKKQKEGN